MPAHYWVSGSACCSRLSQNGNGFRHEVIPKKSTLLRGLGYASVHSSVEFHKYFSIRNACTQGHVTKRSSLRAFGASAATSAPHDWLNLHAPIDVLADCCSGFVFLTCVKVSKRRKFDDSETHPQHLHTPKHTREPHPWNIPPKLPVFHLFLKATPPPMHGLRIARFTEYSMRFAGY